MIERCFIYYFLEQPECENQTYIYINKSLIKSLNIGLFSIRVIKSLSVSYSSYFIVFFNLGMSYESILTYLAKVNSSTNFPLRFLRLSIHICIYIGTFNVNMSNFAFVKTYFSHFLTYTIVLAIVVYTV